MKESKRSSRSVLSLLRCSSAADLPSSLLFTSSTAVIDESASSEDSETEDEPEAERDDSATESEDDEPRRPLPESNDEIRDRLEKSRAAEGLNGKGKGAWREFVDLTKDDEEDGEATDWVMSDEEKQKVQTGDWKGKGKEKARVSSLLT